MIKIAFCDDEITVLEELRGFLDKYRVERNKDIDYVAFRSPFDLLAEIERGKRFDIIFLDDEMPGESGVEAAAEIRKIDNNAKIIFLATSGEYAVDSYQVGAFFYQLKPISQDVFFRLTDYTVSACEKDRANSLILKSKSGITRIRLRQLEYCEVVHRTLFIHLTNGEVLECNGCLDELSQKLEPYDEFLRLHRSYIINLEYVKHISYQAVTMNCSAKLPVPRGKYHNIKDSYLEYISKSNQVII